MCKNLRVYLFLTFCILWLNQGAVSQSYYPSQKYPAEQPGNNLFGILGVMYNPVPYPVVLGETLYHGPTTFYATAYLLDPIGEFDGIHPLLPLSPYYTSGVAMCSVKWPELRLFAPMEVAALIYDPQNVLLDKYLPFASIVTTWPQNGPFNSLSYLNDPPNGFKHPVKSVFATSVLEATQKFTQFTHDFFGWNGMDKEGDQCITTVIDFNHHGTTMYSHNDTLIYHRIATYTPEAPSVSRDLISHEISHGILHHVPTLGNPAYDGYADNPIPLHALMESFCDIMGLSMMNFYEIENGGAFNKPNWRYGTHQDNGYSSSVRPFNKPKNFNHPSTYNGKNFRTVSDPNYAPQSNGMVGDYWFYLLASGEKKEGYIDDDAALGKFEVLPLIPNDKFSSYKLTLDIVFKTFTSGKITLTSDYPDLRKQTLATIVEMGHPAGSHIYRQVMNAWSAVGVGTPWANTYNIECLPGTNALSYYNGDVLIAAQKSTRDQNPTSEMMLTLNDCTDMPGIQTMAIDPETGQSAPLVDGDMNGVFSYENDESLSKVAVSIHKYSSLANSWFKNKFGHIGLDGTGSFKITNAIEPYDGLPLYPAFETSDSIFYYQNEGKSANRDEISRQYFFAVNSFLKNDLYLGTDNLEWQTLREALAGIFALAIKRDYESEAQNPGTEQLWTLNEDLEEPASLMDFSQPKLYGQPAVYNGVNWSPDPKRNSGFLNLFYYLLIHSTADSNGQDEGYTDPELNGRIYFVNKIDKELVLRVLWEAYRSVSVNATIEEFRMATLSELHKLDPVKYHAKSKEHIAFYDAWAAVLGLGDYASTLAHFPEDDAVVYPWAMKVGVEAEYPMYESYRLFEVSTSMAFNDNVAPVYRFVNSSAPDLETGMTYGYINLEPGKYFVRSHLAQGPDSRAHCEATDDPGFCESLLGKEKWTLPYPVTAGPVPAPVSIWPLKGETVPAWSGFFSFGSVVGAMGYDMHVKDPEGTAAEHTIPVDVPYDEDDQSAVIKKKLALSAKKPYSYAVAGKQRLGSEKAVHVLPGGLLQLLTDAEKEQFKTIYSDWTEEISFETDMPTITLKSPADGKHVPLFGEDVVLRSTRLSPDVADYYQFYLKEPFYESPANAEEVGSARFAVHVPGLQGVEDKKAYHWAMVPRKKPEPPFIVEEEEGEVAKWHQFIVDKNLAPKPEVDNIDCVEAGSEPVLHWKTVAGAQTYKLTGVNGTTQTELGSYQTGQLAGKLSNMSTFPNKYVYKVAAGVMGAGGEWIFGPEAIGDYSVTPPVPTNLSPGDESGVPLQENNTVHFKWDDPSQAGNYQFKLVKHENGFVETILSTILTARDILVDNLEFGTTYEFNVQALGANGCNSPTITRTFETEAEPEKENKPINSDLAFTLEELSSDDFDMIIKTPSGYTFTYSDIDRYVQDNTSGAGEDIAFFTDPEEGLYEVSVRIFSINSNKCPAFFTIKALEDGNEKAVIGNNIQVPCNIYFVGAEIGQILNGQVTTFKYTYSK
ncbi:M4 family metallopeptidase [Dyadobacter aurulentus]|uniref:M4 family metallopeptidase n=1 Tax=Dyadobacter sp. UC 10 TaxID=2605428 RepID=UPI0011F18DE5|nr:M4 family metallopeptidase [Dyadobacter sp. UC 10]KAA0991212.1 hypothetical protein FXO21_14095 [Dyadobacter sp. UC 10]